VNTSSKYRSTDRGRKKREEKGKGGKIKGGEKRRKIVKNRGKPGLQQRREERENIMRTAGLTSPIHFPLPLACVQKRRAEREGCGGRKEAVDTLLLKGKSVRPGRSCFQNWKRGWKKGKRKKRGKEEKKGDTFNTMWWEGNIRPFFQARGFVSRSWPIDVGRTGGGGEKGKERGDIKDKSGRIKEGRRQSTGVEVHFLFLNLRKNGIKMIVLTKRSL